MSKLALQSNVLKMPTSSRIFKPTIFFVAVTFALFEASLYGRLPFKGYLNYCRKRKFKFDFVPFQIPTNQ